MTSTVRNSLEAFKDELEGYIKNILDLAPRLHEIEVNVDELEDALTSSLVDFHETDKYLEALRGPDLGASFKKLNLKIDDDFIKRNQYYVKFKESIWNLDHPDQDMPPLIETEDDIVVQTGKKNFLCPLAASILVEPMTSTKCKHSFSRSSITAYLRTESRPCPVSGCSKTVSMSNLRKDDELEKRVKRYLLLQEKNQLSQNMTATTVDQ